MEKPKDESPSKHMEQDQKIRSDIEDESSHDESVSSPIQLDETTEDRKMTPDELNLMTSSSDQWSEMFTRLIKYRDENGNCLVPDSYSVDPQLGTWVATQRRHYKLKRRGTRVPLTIEREKLLNGIGFEWSSRTPRLVPKWDRRFIELLEFVSTNGHAQVPMKWKENAKLSNWVSAQRQEYASLLQGGASRLTREQVLLLHSVGFVWKAPRGGKRRLEEGPIVKPSDDTVKPLSSTNCQATASQMLQAIKEGSSVAALTKKFSLKFGKNDLFSDEAGGIKTSGTGETLSRQTASPGYAPQQTTMSGVLLHQTPPSSTNTSSNIPSMQYLRELEATRPHGHDVGSGRNPLVGLNFPGLERQHMMASLQRSQTDPNYFVSSNRLLPNQQQSLADEQSAYRYSLLSQARPFHNSFLPLAGLLPSTQAFLPSISQTPSSSFDPLAAARLQHMSENARMISNIQSRPSNFQTGRLTPHVDPVLELLHQQMQMFPQGEEEASRTEPEPKDPSKQKDRKVTKK